MNDPQVTAIMPAVRNWIAMPLEQAKDAMRRHMLAEGGFSSLDFDLMNVSESVEEAVGAVFGVVA